MNIHRMDNEKANALSTALFHQDGQGRGRNDGDDVDKVRCFFPHCNAKVVNLHRHIVGVHGKSKKSKLNLFFRTLTLIKHVCSTDEARISNFYFEILEQS